MNSKRFKLLSLFALVAIVLAGISDANAQIRAGVKGGLNVSNLYSDDIDDKNARYGFNAGLYGQVFSTETFAIQPELLYSTRGTRAEYGGIIDQTVKFNLNYLDLPVLAVFKLGDAAEIHLGPYVSYLLSSNIKYSGDVVNGTDEINRDNLKHFDFGVSGGFGLNFGPAQVGARYNLGLTEIADSDLARRTIGDAKNSCAQLYLAFNLNQAK
ncbi:porin family protein [Chryseolinea sp. T2]|uniref:porin family protein n=1 Tax=Chryseolinea sp. T2 TaxID=3129255 RepID=UPI0030786ACB